MNKGRMRTADIGCSLLPFYKGATMKRIVSLFLCVAVLFSVMFVGASEDLYQDVTIKEIAKSLCEKNPAPSFGYIGGEWLVLGIARSKTDVDKSYFDGYYDRIEKYVSDCGGVLHKRKYTEYSRLILALGAIGKNPENVAGYNLLMPLGDFDKTIWQGINGAIWALIALDSGAYEIPLNQEAGTQATRELYIEHIIKNMTDDGGWSMAGDAAEADITAMALCALSKYRYDEKVKAAIERGITCLSGLQAEDGTFASGNVKTAESSAQVLTCLSTLNISLDDPRFVKNGNNVLSAMMKFYSNKAFLHLMTDESVNMMATEQCFYALVAYDRFVKGKNALYDMTDVGKTSANEINVPAIMYPGKGFSDIASSPYDGSILSLAERGIISGKTEDLFEPEGSVTRAEFSKIIVCALGLIGSSGKSFSDVKYNDWFYPYVMTASEKKIINGVSENLFAPNGLITRAEAAAMISRTAAILKINTSLSESEKNDSLSIFKDCDKINNWAVEPLAFCVQKKILKEEGDFLSPQKAITRAESAEMIFVLLCIGGLI